MGDPSPTHGRAAARLAEEPLAPAVAGAVADDPAVAQFISHLRGERNASDHTLSAYLGDLRQFCEQVYCTEAPGMVTASISQRDSPLSTS